MLNERQLNVLGRLEDQIVSSQIRIDNQRLLMERMKAQGSDLGMALQVMSILQYGIQMFLVMRADLLARWDSSDKPDSLRL